MEKRYTVSDCIAQITRRLAPVTDTPRLEAEMLLAHGMQVSRAFLLARLREPVDTAFVEPLLTRRLNHEPLAYIFGEWEFFGLSLYVQAPLLTPRPETEHLVETALNFLARNDSASSESYTIADLCCGTGCVAVAIGKHRPKDCLYASDIRADAVETTRRNASRHGVALQCAQGDLFQPLDALCRRFDVIVANPPYVPEREWHGLSPVITKHEDPGALLAGTDGMDIIRRIIPEAHARLRAGGLLALELGEGQFAAVAELMNIYGFENIDATSDLAGNDRIISATRAE